MSVGFRRDLSGLRLIISCPKQEGSYIPIAICTHTDSFIGTAKDANGQVVEQRDNLNFGAPVDMNWIILSPGQEITTPFFKPFQKRKGESEVASVEVKYDAPPLHGLKVPDFVRKSGALIVGDFAVPPTNVRSSDRTRLHGLNLFQIGFNAALTNR